MACDRVSKAVRKDRVAGIRCITPAPTWSKRATRVVGAALALGFLLAATTAFAGFRQQGEKLVGTGMVGAGSQGRSVALSADGNTAIVGANTDDGGVGAAWVYTRSGTAWGQQGDKLVGTDAVGASAQGMSVALSADGSTAIIGGMSDNGSVGAAWVFTRSGGVWIQQGAKLVGSDAVGASIQGYSVALSADGNTAIVGGYNDNFGIGAAWVYTRSGGVWSQHGPKLVGWDVVGAARQGRSVALSADGNTAIVGGNLDNGSLGAAWIWVRGGGSWAQEGSKLVGTGAVGNANQGRSVGLSADGNTAIVGGPNDNGNLGAAWVFTRSGSAWSQQGEKLVGVGAVGAANLGRAIGLSDDGNRAFVGGPTDDGGVGAAWAFARSAGEWIQLGSKIVGTGGSDAELGWSVALSGDGTTAMAGGPNDNGNLGAAWVFAYSPAPAISAVTDVPNDQGRRVRVSWGRCDLDAVGWGQSILSYSIYRRIDGGAGAVDRGRVDLETAGGSWDFVLNLPASCEPDYNALAETLCDSTDTGTCWSVFFVRAHTAAPGTYYDSEPDSGYSKDNLAPSAPANLALAAGLLGWDDPTDPDFRYFSVYGSDSPSLDGTAVLIGHTIATSFDVSSDDYAYYHVTATDFAGNEGPAASASGTTGVADGVPIRFALRGGTPNPFGVRTAIGFDLPRAGAVRLEVYDLAGRAVRTLADRFYPAGRHAVEWDGSGASGRRLQAGVYMYRLRAAGFTATRRVVLMP